ncbi:phosphate ABC transporter permease PstA [Haloarcula onubensis]|uniref:Phosphate transport system permease protein PstA n=1 Tax=Haloarcula onubensis TaxID=2950539 RepID=A0ABU2FTM2_9EURY|nr:phosphate ABC transporter permease PstA [Halomicroarcula sp. S3CR25-11]MDS0283637.1 phosphate ABC transporter permease PstA [Halomicroarcula sp. S3CR25-11]
MATETETGFGQVSRLRGTVFRYLTFGASLVGILALGVLLAYVFWDALGLDTAGTTWYLTYTVTLLAPLLGFLAYARDKPEVTAGALELVGLTLAGGMLSFAAIIVLLVIAGPQVWFTYFLTVVAPVIGLFLYGQYDREATWVGLAMLGAVIAGPIAGTLLLGVLGTAAALLGAPGVYFLSLVVPGAGLAAFLAAERFDASRRVTVAVAAAIPVLAIVGVPLVDTVPAVARSVWFAVLVMLGVPLGYAVVNTARRPARRAAFVLPAVVVGGFLVGELAVGALGAAQPSPWLDWQFLTSPTSSLPAKAGLYPAVIGSVFLIILVSIFTFVFGVGTALYLEEYAPSSGPLGTLTRLINVNISNLAGVPSVVYGLLGLGIFVNVEFQLGPTVYGGIGAGTVLTAALTLSLLILPIVVISAQEAIRSVPDSLRQASYGMGATRWQTIRNVVLPRSLPGILTGTILALGRAIGETAPLIMIGAVGTKYTPPGGLFDTLTAMPMQIYTWAFLPSAEFRYGVVAAGVVTLLIVLLSMNSVAILVRNKYQQEAY